MPNYVRSPEEVLIYFINRICFTWIQMVDFVFQVLIWTFKTLRSRNACPRLLLNIIWEMKSTFIIHSSLNLGIKIGVSSDKLKTIWIYLVSRFAYITSITVESKFQIKSNLFRRIYREIVSTCESKRNELRDRENLIIHQEKIECAFKCWEIQEEFQIIALIIVYVWSYQTEQN